MQFLKAIPLLFSAAIMGGVVQANQLTILHINDHSRLKYIRDSDHPQLQLWNKDKSTGEYIKYLNSFFKLKLQEADKELYNSIKDEFARQQNHVELIASENFVSDQVMEAMGSVMTNKYAEGYPGKRYYGGCEIVDQTEQIAIDRAKALFGAEYANVQPHSGAQANAAVMLACLNTGDAILGFDLSHGGHLTHGSPVNFSGKLYQSNFYGVEESTGTTFVVFTKLSIFVFDNCK